MRNLQQDPQPIRNMAASRREMTQSRVTQANVTIRLLTTIRLVYSIVYEARLAGDV